MKYFACGWLCLFRWTAVQEHDVVECDMCETGSSSPESLVLHWRSFQGAALNAGLA
jgi:hypothetical protein